MERCECEKTAVYELLRTDMVSGPAQVFTRYHEKDITRIRPHGYQEKGKLTKVVIGYDANSLYLCCSGDVMAKTGWLRMRSHLIKNELQNFQRMF